MANLVPFDVDLTAHEGTRLAAVLEALGPDWDPVEVYAGEAEARQMLYSNLDADQQSCYDLLIAHGVISDAMEWSQ
jgi:Family of unknown function (DUF6400)